MLRRDGGGADDDLGAVGPEQGDLLRGDLVRQMGIPRRSTLVMMVGTTELGRLVAETGREAIASLLDLAGS